MNPEFRAAILQALQLTRSQNVMEATRVIQRAIAGFELAAPPVDEPRERAPAPPPSPAVSATADAVEPLPKLFLNKDPTIKTDFSAAMRQAMLLTCAQNLMEATRVIQRALAGSGPATPPVDEPRERAPALPPPPAVSGTVDAVEPPPQLFLNKDPTMKTDFSAAMRQALQLTRSLSVMEATRVTQRVLAGFERAAPPVDDPRERAPALPPPSAVSGTADAVEPPQQRARMANSGEAATERRPSRRPRRRLGEVLKLLRQVELSGLRPGAAPLPGLRRPSPCRRAPPISREASPAPRVRGTTRSTSRAAPRAAGFRDGPCLPLTTSHPP
jgi:hypothetical protein